MSELWQVQAGPIDVKIEAATAKAACRLAIKKHKPAWLGILIRVRLARARGGRTRDKWMYLDPPVNVHRLRARAATTGRKE